MSNLAGGRQADSETRLVASERGFEAFGLAYARMQLFPVSRATADDDGVQ